MKRLPAAIALLSLSAVAASASASPPPSLCSAAETSVFSCAANGKIISLCAAAERGGRQTLRYAFGTKAKLDLEIRQSSQPQAFSSGVTALSGGGIDYVRVKNGAFAYVVYTGQSKGWSQDGWVVEANGAAISHHICRGSATGDQVWGPVYAAKLPKDEAEAGFHPPDWTGGAPKGR